VIRTSVFSSWWLAGTNPQDTTPAAPFFSTALCLRATSRTIESTQWYGFVRSIWGTPFFCRQQLAARAAGPCGFEKRRQAPPDTRQTCGQNFFTAQRLDQKNGKTVGRMDYQSACRQSCVKVQRHHLFPADAIHLQPSNMLATMDRRTGQSRTDLSPWATLPDHSTR